MANLQPCCATLFDTKFSMEDWDEADTALVMSVNSQIMHGETYTLAFIIKL